MTLAFQYRVTITHVTARVGEPEELTGITEVLSLRAYELHEIAPMLAALYPTPKVKRQHRKKQWEPLASAPAEVAS